MPKLGLTMSEGTVATWFADDGAHVDKGQAICEIETDKAVMEILADAEGFLRHAVPAGSVVPAGSPIGHIE